MFDVNLSIDRGKILRPRFLTATFYSFLFEKQSSK